MLAALTVVLLLSTVAAKPVPAVNGVPPLERVEASCKDYAWFKCPPAYGLPANNTRWGNCCKNSTYCPAIANQCTPASSCCQSGFPYYCQTAEGAWCCPTGYSVCGAGKQCLAGGCECTGCIGPNPCKFGISCSDCKACCANYIPAICKGWGCSGGGVASQNFQAVQPCPV